MYTGTRANNSSLEEYSRIKVGPKVLEDASLELGQLQRLNSRLGAKINIQRAIEQGNLAEMIAISNYFARQSGLYRRLCKHLSNFYRYDWILTVESKGKIDNAKLLEAYNKQLNYLDLFQVKKFLGETAYSVIVNGAYYGYLIFCEDTAYVQELPMAYCRSRMRLRGKPIVEFNMSFFDDYYPDRTYRVKMLQAWPKEVQRGYQLYVEGKLPAEASGEKAGWYALDPECAFKFNSTPDDYPLFISTIPHILDLDDAQELDRKKMAQKLLKIIIQKMPLDKNGDLIFDVDEAQELHNNAVRMLAKSIGVDVLTTFADVDVADLADKSSVTSIDELEKVERTVFNEAGTAQNLFNTDGNIALEKSLLDDEASIYNLLLQFEAFLNDIVKRFNKKTQKKYVTRVSLLPTTVYNYKEMSKLYKEQTQLGFSLFLPQVALGLSQSTILASAHFENEVLNLPTLLTPPMSSNTMSSKDRSARGGQSAPKGEEKKVGRQEKSDDEKSEKTIQNLESMS